MPIYISILDEMVTVISSEFQGDKVCSMFILQPAKTVARHKYYFQFYFCSNNVWVVCCWEKFSLSARNLPQIVNPVKYFHWNSSAKSILQFITFSNYLDGGGQEGHWEAGCWQGRKGKWSSVGLFYTDYNFRSHIPSSSSSWSTKSNLYC